MTDKTLPTATACERCGSTDIFVEREDLSAYQTRCNDCGSRGPIVEEARFYDDEQAGQAAAIAAWNRRSAVQEAADLTETAKRIAWEVNYAIEGTNARAEDVEGLWNRMPEVSRARYLSAARAVTPAQLPVGYIPLPAGLHPDTAKLVTGFAEALAAKLRLAEAKYGYSDGWRRDDWRGELVAKLVEHVHKGDPRDVAAYCAFAWFHGWSITPAPQADFQQRIQQWMHACFGAEISADKLERNHRFLEEALELVQACGCTQSEAHQLVDYVFGRPVGEPRQEVGGVMVTLAALCLAQGLDMAEAGETELARIWTKVEAIRAKQASKTKGSPLPAAAPVSGEA